MLALHTVQSEHMYKAPRVMLCRRINPRAVTPKVLVPTYLAYQYRLKTCTKLAILSARTWPGMASP